MHESYPTGVPRDVSPATPGLPQHQSDQLNLKVGPLIKQSVRSHPRFNALKRKLHLVDYL
ncbi:MAG: hypothetical protein WCB10_20665 [Steroidobacteraceae bacterium]